MKKRKSTFTFLVLRSKDYPSTLIIIIEAYVNKYNIVIDIIFIYHYSIF
jgi:hypothetical protein